MAMHLSRIATITESVWVVRFSWDCVFGTKRSLGADCLNWSAVCSVMLAAGESRLDCCCSGSFEGRGQNLD